VKIEFVKRALTSKENSFMKEAMSKSIVSVLFCLLLFVSFSSRATACPPPCPDCYYWDDYESKCVWACGSNICCGGECCNPDNCCSGDECCGSKCCNGVCCDVDRPCCNGVCCDSGYCCGGEICCEGKKCCTQPDPYCCETDETCCDGTCCDSATEKCCDDIGGDDDGYCCNDNETCCEGICCPEGETCCEGNCCPDGCCEYEVEIPWCTTRECGCDPVLGGCDELKERTNPTKAYWAIGTGSKCRIPQGEVTCYEWRWCEEAGYHAFQVCFYLGPEFPPGYCTSAPSFYCQDCRGAGEWYNFEVTSTRCQ